MLAGVGKDDTEKDVDSLAAKILKAKLWPDEQNPGASVCYTVDPALPICDSNALLSGSEMSRT